MIAAYIGRGFTIAGREQARFELKGTFADGVEYSQTAAGPAAMFASNSSQPTSPDWYARLLAPWKSANLYGLPIGRGRISAEMDGNQIRIEPLDFPIGGGKLTASPHIRLEPEPGELTLDPGPLLTEVQVTPEVSDRLLKFILPPLADATDGQGVFSMSLTGAKIPLGEPKKADVAGRLTVHSVKVVPGPMVNEWIGIVREIEALARSRNPQAVGREPITLVSMSDRTIDSAWLMAACIIRG